MALHFPSLWATILQEKKAIRNVIKKNKIDLIISDNRFGAHSNEIPSVFITHQVNIKTPHLNKWVNKLNHRAIKKFSYCWIPDFEVSPGLAGELSHPPLEKIKSAYIGPQSRFRFSEEEKKFDITVVLSGPEPQRTILEDILFEQLFIHENLKINLVRGIYTSDEKGEVKNILVYDHLQSEELEKLLHQSKHIICRSGYSGIMDLQYMDSKILLVPTPQQTEQEYLAELHSEIKKYFVQSQDKIDVSEFLKENPLVEKENCESKTDFMLLVNEILK
jgi:UDP-N-acetylglucosamine transferase subunit ALG13